MQASLPSGSASTQNAGASASDRTVPPAASVACDALVRLVVRHRDVEVDPVALRPRRVHLLEPDRRPLAERVDQAVLRRPAPAGLVGVAEHRLPERPDRGDVQRVDADLEHLDRGPGCVVSRNSCATAEIRRASSTSRVVTQAARRSAARRPPGPRGRPSAGDPRRRAAPPPGPATSAASGSDPVSTWVLNSPRTYRQPRPVTAAEASVRDSLVCSMPSIVPAGAGRFDPWRKMDV